MPNSISVPSYHGILIDQFLTGENGEMNLINLEALTGETILEKERRLSEMILQLQMVRDQLLSQQEQHKTKGLSPSIHD
ncbi:unnamed protein product [Nezara viridula]|uniref:Uncharacterized protein n=1 Tax=Nezara viridula TaxID=85310 RepID=A0A9P0EEY8_NEZVI|nr:unnamed protein product [Nezara viridula]